MKTEEKIKKVKVVKVSKKTVKKSAEKPEKKVLAEIGDAKVYSQKGVEIDTVKLPENIFGLSWNADLVHQVVVSMLSDARVIYAHTQDRGEIRGGGKKPWRQKGTGRARHGSSRSPIWVGGGIAHGPNGLKNYGRKINKKMKAKALFTILSKKFRDGEVVFVDRFEIEKPKTTEAIAILKNLSKVATTILTKKKNSAIIATASKNPVFEKSFANLGNVTVDEFRNINPIDLMNTKYLVIENPAESIKFISNKMAKAK